MSNNYLNNNFLDELFKLAFVKKTVLEVIREKLKYSYIPVEYKEYKLILQSIINQYDLSGKLPSFGVVSQQYQNDSGVQIILSKIKEANIVDVDNVLTQLNIFVRDIRFQMLFEDVYNKYNKGEKEGAIKDFISGADEISKISIRDNKGQFLRVFADFKEQLKERQIISEAGEDIKRKIPFGIDILDSITEGGLDKGETALWIMPSGRGKSTALKWTGMTACRLGYDVLHIQLEGSKREAFDKYTQIWTGCLYKEVKWGNISREKMIKIDRVLDDILLKQRDLEVFSFEKFGMASMVEIRALVDEYYKIKGKLPSLIIIDSLDLLTSGINKKIDFDPAYKKDRLQTVAQLMKNLAVELDLAILTATQTGDIAKQLWNNPDWCITRENTEGDRTLVKPFSFVFTGNTTLDEKKKNMTRVFIDKLRFYDPKDEIYPIHTALNVGKFYDRQKTLKEYSYMYEGKEG
jgi:hypothetical protein